MDQVIVGSFYKFLKEAYMLYCSEANDQTEAVLNIKRLMWKTQKWKSTISILESSVDNGINNLVPCPIISRSRLYLIQSIFVGVDTILFCQQQCELCTMAPHSSQRHDVTWGSTSSAGCRIPFTNLIVNFQLWPLIKLMSKQMLLSKVMVEQLVWQKSHMHYDDGW